jgi:protein-disulfide isomerase
VLPRRTICCSFCPSWSVSLRTRTGSATAPPPGGSDVTAHPTAPTSKPANLCGHSTGETGLSVDATHKALDSDAYAGDVLDDISQALAFGVSGLPFCIIDRAYGISGAQPVETILDTLRKAASPFVA